MAAPPLDSPCDGPVTYPGDNTEILEKSSRERIQTYLLDISFSVCCVQIIDILFVIKRDPQVKIAQISIWGIWRLPINNMLTKHIFLVNSDLSAM